MPITMSLELARALEDKLATIKPRPVFLHDEDTGELIEVRRRDELDDQGRKTGRKVKVEVARYASTVELARSMGLDVDKLGHHEPDPSPKAVR